MAGAIVVATVAQYDHSSGRPTFSAANFFSYFTVISNVLFAVVLLALVARPALRDEAGFGTVRGTAALGIIATGLVYAVLLAPAAADVDVTLRWVDLALHTVAPIFGLLDWLVDPPRRRPTLQDAASWLVLSVVWVIYTMVRGPIADWYPYPFLDPDEESVGSIVVTCIGIAVVFAVIAAGLRWWAGRRSPIAAA
jgi:hypothetical protein